MEGTEETVSINKPVYLRAFNSQFQELLEDIDRVIPNNLDVMTMKNALDKLRKANPKLILTMWYKWVVQIYGEEVEKGNFEFFINKDYKSDLQGYKHEGAILEGIERMRDVVRELDETNKNHALEYVKNLCTLSKIYTEN